MTQTQYHIPACTVQPLRDGLAVVRLLYCAIHPMYARHISARTGLPVSSVEKLLYTLEIEGMVERDKLGQWDISAAGLLSVFEREQA